MPDLLNPAAALDDLAHVFEVGARDGGLVLDAVLCGAFRDAIRDIRAGVSALLDCAILAGAVTTHGVAEIAPMSPAERRRLARLATPLDPDGRVIRLPTGRAPAAIAEGGPAA